MNIPKKLRELFAELRELSQRISGESLREFYERYVPQPSRLEVARIPVRSELRGSGPVSRQRRR
jgi:hypothetical protein